MFGDSALEGPSESRSRLFEGLGLAWGSGKSPTLTSSYKMSQSLPAECHLNYPQSVIIPTND